MTQPLIPYARLGDRAAEVKQALLAAVERVVDGGNYILGPEVDAFEREFAAFCGTKYALGVDNGTSALILALKALGVGPGDEVITAPNSFIASVSSIVVCGATPVLADISPDFNIDPNKIEAAITSKTKAIMPVHLTGRPAKMEEINALAKTHRLSVIEDSAQSVGAKLNGKRVGGLSSVGCFSLHPLKNLHAFGDAGIMTFNDDAQYEYLKKARNHGFKNRNECDFFSYNFRLDELQAAMLRVQLSHLEEWTETRRRKAFRYNEELKDVVLVPEEGKNEYCVFQTYVARAERRDDLIEALQKAGVDAKIHYPIPIYRQKAAASLKYTDADFPVAAKASHEIISLPLYPRLTEDEQGLIISTIRKFYGR